MILFIYHWRLLLGRRKVKNAFLEDDIRRLLNFEFEFFFKKFFICNCSNSIKSKTILLPTILLNIHFSQSLKNDFQTRLPDSNTKSLPITRPFKSSKLSKNYERGHHLIEIFDFVPVLKVSPSKTHKSPIVKG